MGKLFSCFIILGFLCCTALAKSRRPIADYEIREKKDACYADIESGLWGWQCKSSKIAKENCALRCLSPTCYTLIYESDPLEEGEKDYIRGQEYKFCMHKFYTEKRNETKVELRAIILRGEDSGPELNLWNA